MTSKLNPKADAQVIILPGLTEAVAIERLVESTHSTDLRLHSAELLASIYRAAELVHQECELHLEPLAQNRSPEIAHALATLDDCAQKLAGVAGSLSGIIGKAHTSPATSNR